MITVTVQLNDEEVIEHDRKACLDLGIVKIKVAYAYYEDEPSFWDVISYDVHGEEVKVDGRGWLRAAEEYATDFEDEMEVDQVYEIDVLNDTIEAVGSCYVSEPELHYGEEN